MRNWRALKFSWWGGLAPSVGLYAVAGAVALGSERVVCVDHDHDHERLRPAARIAAVGSRLGPMNPPETSSTPGIESDPTTAYEPPAVVARGPVGDSQIGYGGRPSDAPPPSPAWSVRRSGT